MRIFLWLICSVLSWFSVDVFLNLVIIYELRSCFHSWWGYLPFPFLLDWKANPFPSVGRVNLDLMGCERNWRTTRPAWLTIPAPLCWAASDTWSFLCSENSAAPAAVCVSEPEQEKQGGKTMKVQTHMHKATQLFDLEVKNMLNTQRNKLLS